MLCSLAHLSLAATALSWYSLVTALANSTRATAKIKPTKDFIVDNRTLHTTCDAPQSHLPVYIPETIVYVRIPTTRHLFSFLGGAQKNLSAFLTLSRFSSLFFL
uniref:Secreted protein n=1 Tax=Lygus hesperus TaxID=30085 RepID=A0A146LDJ8_LYGHE